MKKVDLKMVAEEFEIIDSETQLFYNTETGEFDYYNELMDLEDDDSEKFEDDCWIAAPRQIDIGEYDIMIDFTKTVTNQRTQELLSTALEGKGAFRRFKDTLHGVALTDEWYAFKRNAYVDIARQWCEKNDIDYEDTEQKEKHCNNKSSLEMIITPLSEKAREDVAEVLCSSLKYSKADANETITDMLKKPRIAFMAIVDSHVIGIIGAIPQYGVTGWELHPLAVLGEYQRRGVGSALVDKLECEVVQRGGVMIYLGSDDETGKTSLYGADLYDNTFDKIANIQNIGEHPYQFYEKLGYKIIGVFPDANGIGKPDIWMTKRIMRA